VKHLVSGPKQSGHLVEQPYTVKQWEEPTDGMFRLQALILTSDTDFTSVNFRNNCVLRP